MRDKSLINPELSIDEVLEAMVLYVIENEVRAEPFRKCPHSHLRFVMDISTDGFK
jgi:hypothetical protein